MACTFKDTNRNFSRPYYEAWDFPLVMSEKDIINAIREAYENASIRSRRISPNKISQIDFENLDRVFEVDYHPLGNYECLYQGRAGDLIIRFLFDYKNTKIVMAYPVLKEAELKDRYQEYHYYSKKAGISLGIIFREMILSVGMDVNNQEIVAAMMLANICVGIT